jgi:hypothetical protein
MFFWLVVWLVRWLFGCLVGCWLVRCWLAYWLILSPVVLKYPECFPVVECDVECADVLALPLCHVASRSRRVGWGCLNGDIDRGEHACRGPFVPAGFACFAGPFVWRFPYNFV